MDNEVWKSVVGFEDSYEVSNYGRVRSLPRGRTKGQILKPYLNRYGYHVISIRKESGGKTYCLKVHRIVASAFIENPDNLPYINHKDENKINNAVDNLEWCTPYYNTHYGSCIEKIRKSHKGKPYLWLKDYWFKKGHKSTHTPKSIEKIRIATSILKSKPVIAINAVTGFILEFRNVSECKKHFHISRLAKIIRSGLAYKGHCFYYAERE